MRRASEICFLMFCVHACLTVSLPSSWFEALDEDVIEGDSFPADPFSDFDPSEVSVDEPGKVQKNTQTDPETQTVTDIPSGSDKDVDKLMSTVKEQDDRIKTLETLNKRLEDKIDEIEQQTKVNNLIFTNVREGEKENHRSTLQIVLHVLNSLMNVETKAEDISVALRVDSNTNSTGVRPIHVTFTNFATKMRVLAARSRLKQFNIEVSADYSEKVTSRRLQLLPFLMQKRALGLRAYMLYDKLVVDGVKKTLEDLLAEKKEEEKSEDDRQEEEAVDEDTSRDEKNIQYFSFTKDGAITVDL